MGLKSWACAPGRGYWLRVVGVGVAAAVAVTVLIAALDRATPVSMFLRHALVHSLIMAGLCGALMPGIRRSVAAARPATQWAVTIAGLLGLAAGGTLLALAVLTLGGMHGRDTLGEAFAFAFPINAVVSLTLGLGLTLFEAQRSRLAAVTLELRTRELEHERQRKLALQARLASLESRLQPHFLFNTLNAISALVQEDPEQAERTVERLAALLRFSLDATERGVVPLEHELKIVTDYLEIERTRLGERLDYTLHVDPEAADAEVPPLAVQTLVENSVKHAIAPRPGGGWLRVNAVLDGERLVLSVRDDGDGSSEATLRPGHGLEMLRARLAARYGAAASLTIGSEEDGGLVTLSLPRRSDPPP
jgi:LytS/YehU family sensor histidine kinase